MLALPHIDKINHEHVRHPAAIAEEQHFRQRVAFRAAQRLEQMDIQARREEASRARAVAIGAYFERQQMEAERRVQAQIATASALVAPLFSKMGVHSSLLQPSRSIQPELPPVHVAAPTATSVPSQPSQNPRPPPPRAKNGAAQRPKPSRKKATAVDSSLNSAQTVRAVLDVLYAKVELEHTARGRPRPGSQRAPLKSLAQVAREYAEASEASSSEMTGTLAGVRVANGLLGLRIGCAECDPHPVVILFRRLMGWDGSAAEDSLPARQLEALWMLFLWLMPAYDRMQKSVAQQMASQKDTQTQFKSGAEPVYETMPKRTTIEFDAVRRVLDLMAERRLLDHSHHSKYLYRAARSFKEKRRSGPSGSVIDVEELLLCWTLLWNEWRKDIDADDFASMSGVPPVWKIVRVDREALAAAAAAAAAKQKLAPSDKRLAAQEVEKKRKQAAGILERDAHIDVVTGVKLFAGNALAVKNNLGVEVVDDDAPVREEAEEHFAAGMRANAMEFDVGDSDGDRKLDFDEFCVWIAQRERGPHSAFEMRARFNALDADKSGQIDLHEFVRFSLRDALARDSARVVDLLREWDSDKNGVIDRKEFHRAIKALGFGALAGKEDIDIVFDMLDESKDGLIEFKELNRMLRQSAEVDAAMAGGAQGRVALDSEVKAKLKRTSAPSGNRAGGAGTSILASDVKATLAREVLDQLKAVFGAAPEKVMLLFKEIDTSGDGLVSRKEFALAMRALGLALPHRELRLLFESLDPDRSNSIDYAELREALES